MVGNKVERNPDLVRRELKDGHELANHTFSHSYLTAKTSISKMKSEIELAEEAIWKVSGQKCHLFRPPGGFYNEQLVNVAKEKGYKVVMWSWHQDTRDWSSPGVKKIVDSVLNHTRNGDIILFHEYVEGKSQTVDALKIILPELKQRGYRFVTITELLSQQKLKPMVQE
ncbi:Bifunctional xylanase/deacetylase precursor [compost metagenome]